MKQYNDVYSDNQPQEIEITENQVFVASNIKEYDALIDEHEVHGFKYDYTVYSKDEYIEFLSKQSQKIDQLEEELAAAKILLGVE